MKFGKALQETSERFSKMPFMRYKFLKQVLKCITLEADYDGTTNVSGEIGEDSGPKYDNQFMTRLSKEVHDLNMYFIGEEEELVIRMQDLEAASRHLQPKQETDFVPKLVKFHGDVVLLLHWQFINFIACSKILKKHDKLLKEISIRKQVLESLIRQPFYSKELLERLLQQCEAIIDRILPKSMLENDTSLTDLERLGDDRSLMTGLRKMQYAIRTWKDLGDNAHTPSTVLPWSKPIPESMKKWLAARNGENQDSFSEKEDGCKDEFETSKESCTNEDADNESTTPDQTTKRSHRELLDTETGDNEAEERITKIARNNP